MRVQYEINKRFADDLNKLIDNYTDELLWTSKTGIDAICIASALDQERYNLPAYALTPKGISDEVVAILQGKINKKPLF